MRIIVYLTAAVLLGGLAPAGLAGHGQMIDGAVRMFVFHPDLFSDFLVIDWLGVGGSGGSGVPIGANGQDLELQNPEPDDCADFDETLVVYGLFYFAFPSVAFKTVEQEETTIVPGQSVVAPAELLLLCNTVRENLNGQEPGYQYASQPQRVGFGDIKNEAFSAVLPTGDFTANDTFGNGTALPLTLTAKICHIGGFVSTSSQGDEFWAIFGFPNGVIDPPAAADLCLDISDDVIAYVLDPQTGEASDWDLGEINSMGGSSLYDLKLFPNNIQFGLNALCFNAEVVDWSGTQFSFFEDYGYFWVDGQGNLFANTPNWAQPANTDAIAFGQDCSSLGIVV